jgi:hypothetical protein
MRWHYRDRLLVWLLPLAYACHILEEWFGGFPEWLAVIAGSPLPRAAFVVINGVAIALMILAARAATQRESHGWMAIAIATILLVNGIAHILGSLVTGTYSPGLFTGVILYLPLAQLVLLRAWSQAGKGMFGSGVAAGLALHALVVVIAYTMATGFGAQSQRAGRITPGNDMAPTATPANTRPLSESAIPSRARD